ncbi:MAG: porphobilinogen synthase [Fibrobacteria bacterium]|nr:porphobilinogen synthase [Fibrobacteria bacterium]
MNEHESHQHPHTLDIISRPRRNRRTDSIRKMVRETILSADDLILPLFVKEGKGKREAVPSMPGIFRNSLKDTVAEAMAAFKLGIPAVALFPALANSKKDQYASESMNPKGLLQETVAAIKTKVPGITVITDVAMDPYSSDGHDGLVENGRIDNDKTVKILGEMALSQARAGADIVAPSDMMDGRVGYIRERLDYEGFTDVGILAYSAKYASAFYGPFRDALQSAPKASKNIPGDKKTYQMDPANVREALKEVYLDVEEGADMIMVKPALPYLDIITTIKSNIELPVAAYNVSGEYAMIKAAAQKGWLDENAAMMESLLSIKRAGADMILTYFAKDAAKLLG